MKRLTLLACVGMAFAGCYQTRVLAVGAGGGKTVEQGFHHNVIKGLVELGEVDVDAECAGAGASEFRYQVSFLNAIVGNLTGLIYTPVSTSVTCNAGGQAAL